MGYLTKLSHQDRSRAFVVAEDGSVLILEGVVKAGAMVFDWPRLRVGHKRVTKRQRLPFGARFQGC